MDPEQIELLTHDKTLAESLRNHDVRRILDSLPIKPSPAEIEAVKSSISDEAEDLPTPGESTFTQAFFTGLSWMTCGLVVAAALFLAWAVGGSTFR